MPLGYIRIMLPHPRWISFTKLAWWPHATWVHYNYAAKSSMDFFYEASLIATCHLGTIKILDGCFPTTLAWKPHVTWPPECHIVSRTSVNRLKSTTSFVSRVCSSVTALLIQGPLWAFKHCVVWFSSLEHSPLLLFPTLWHHFDLIDIHAYAHMAKLVIAAEKHVIAADSTERQHRQPAHDVGGHWMAHFITETMRALWTLRKVALANSEKSVNSMNFEKIKDCELWTLRTQRNVKSL